MKSRVLGIVLAALGLAAFAALVYLRARGIAVLRPYGLLEIPLGGETVLLVPRAMLAAAILVDIGVLLLAGSRLADWRELTILLIVFTAFAFMCDASEVFLRWENLSAILLAISTQGIIVIGMTILLVSGGFDLSVGSTFGLTGAVTALCMVVGLPVPTVAPAFPFLAVTYCPLHPLAAAGVGLAVGGLIGTANGLIIAKVRINAFITTLAMMYIVRGILEVITQGQNIAGLPPAFNRIGQAAFAGVQYPILISLVLVALGDLALRKLRFFRQNYYLGGNERAAILSGINVDNMKIFNYALTGLLAAVAGIINTARFGAASLTTGTGLELQVITAVIIGGASLQGGEGTVLGSFLGCILMAVIVTSLNLLHVSIYWQRLIIGLVLLVAVMIDMLGKRQRGAT